MLSLESRRNHNRLEVKALFWREPREPVAGVVHTGVETVPIVELDLSLAPRGTAALITGNHWSALHAALTIARVSRLR